MTNVVQNVAECCSIILNLIGIAQLHFAFFSNSYIIYSIALDQIFYPLIDELTKSDPSTSREQLIEGSQIEELQRLLYCKLQGGIQLNVLIEMLCQEVESFVGRISKKLHFLETVVYFQNLMDNSTLCLLNTSEKLQYLLNIFTTARFPKVLRSSWILDFMLICFLSLVSYRFFW